MIGLLSNKLSLKLCKHNLISEEDIDLMTYGFFLLFSYIIYALACLVFGILFHCIAQCIIFYVSFSTLRMFAGGFHASTEYMCFIISSVMILFAIYSIQLLNDNRFYPIFLILTALSSVVIILFAPLDNANKKLDKKSKQKYRKISIIILIAFLITVSVFWFYYKAVTFPIGMTVIVEGMLILFEKLHTIINKFKIKSSEI